MTTPDMIHCRVSRHLIVKGSALLSSAKVADMHKKEWLTQQIQSIKIKVTSAIAIAADITPLHAHTVPSSHHIATTS
jgi:hypothetical protein